MAKVLGFGGVFWKANDKAKLVAFYTDALGIDMHDWGAVFMPDAMAAQPGACSVLSLKARESEYFAPSTRDFMVNLVVDDLDGVLARCKSHGCEPVRIIEESNGRFAHIIDPEGTKLELWQPKE